MMYIKKIRLTVCCALAIGLNNNGIAATTYLYTDVLVAGGTASGTTAAIQAARSGVHVVMIESSLWLGGMLTSAGVSATDGNHLLPSGLWGEFRSNLYDYYGGSEAVHTGWVSYTQFEPHVGNQIFSSMVDQEDRIISIHGYHVIKCLMSDLRLQGAIFINDSATDTLVIRAKITIDATEAGDVMAMAGCRYFIGQDSKSITGELGAPDKATDIIQDLTYVAVLKDYGTGTDKTIAKPDSYNPLSYECTCLTGCNNPDKDIYDCNKMLDYGKLPNGKYMINWPDHGNDYYLNDLEMDYYARKKVHKAAKDFTLGWIYYIQTQAGFSHLGLADDEFPTTDKLALYPYYRESRRMEGMIQLRNDDLVDPYADRSRPFYKYAISVGDYPLDLHHEKMPHEISYSIQPVPSFSVPYGCLVPKEIDGLLVAEKSISVSHIVNGCTRLQPSVMLIGQAAGEAAALCVKNRTEPRKLNIRQLQQNLLDAKCWLMPYLDVTPDDPCFQHIQKIGLCGLMRGEGIIIDWANKTYFYPDNELSLKEFQRVMDILKGVQENPMDFNTIRIEGKAITREKALKELWKFYSNKHPGTDPSLSSAISFLNSKLHESVQLNSEKLKGYTTRKELACWVDLLFDPFNVVLQ